MLHLLIAVSNSRNIDLDGFARSLGMRRFTARSVVLSVLLGSHPPRLPVSILIDFCGLFGIRDGTVRTALSRMVSAGDLALHDASYEVTGTLLERQRQQDIGRTRPATSWDGSWWTAVVLADARGTNERRRFRSSMAGAKMGELRPDVWMRPANIDPPADADQLLVSRGDLDLHRSCTLVTRLWDLDELESRTARMLDAVRTTEIGRPETLPTAFIALAACLQFLRTEPQLPGELADPSPADDLRATYLVSERAFQQALASFLSDRSADLGSM